MPKTKELIQIISPRPACPIADTRPNFHWRVNKTVLQNKKIAQYQLKLVGLRSGQDARKALQRSRPLLDIKSIVRRELPPTLSFPQSAASLKGGRTYAYQISAFEKNGALIGQSDIGMFYVEKGDLPFRLADLFCCDGNILEPGIEAWHAAYGSPEFKPKSQDCFQNSGVIALDGNQSSGDAIYQLLDDPITAGTPYTLQFCANFHPKQSDHIRFRVIAFNGSLPTNGEHPVVSANVQIIHETSRISETGWTQIMLPPWYAPKNFTQISILAFSDDPSSRGYGDVAGICMKEHSGDECGVTVNATVAEDGTITLPDELLPYQQPDYPPQVERAKTNHGRLVDMYGDMFDEQGKLAWYPNSQCVSVGGSLPPEAEDVINNVNEPIDFGQGITPAHIQTAMECVLQKIGMEPDISHFPPIPPLKQKTCHKVPLDKKRPFGGRDIIYVHGFRPDHVMQKIVRRDGTGYLQSLWDDPLDDGIDGRWPENSDAFVNGFYKQEAEKYWYHHIEQHLKESGELGNRYLVVGFNTNQRLIENIHAVLYQIAQAMNDGTGVKFHEKDSRGNECFGQDCVIVSHSTGSLLTDAAMSITAQTATISQYDALFAAADYIPRGVKAHIAFHGAIGGSEYASLGVAGANFLALAANAIDVGVDVGVALNNSDNDGIELLKAGLMSYGVSADAIANFFDQASDQFVLLAEATTPTVNQSLFVDLSPVIAKTLWRRFVQNMPIPVLTIAGGHPADYWFGKAALPGLDDGVVNSNSQSASPSWFQPNVYLYLPPAPRIFDLGIAPGRSLVYFAEQYQGPALAAYGSTPFLSPSGMVQPVQIMPEPLPRYRNHFIFTQAASNHNHPKDEDQAGNYKPSLLNEVNDEESLVIDHPFLFESGLVNEDIQELMEVTVRGEDLSWVIQIPYPVVSFFPPQITIQQLTFRIVIPIWRRTYHLLNAPPDLAPVEGAYAYRYVLR